MKLFRRTASAQPVGALSETSVEYLRDQIGGCRRIKVNHPKRQVGFWRSIILTRHEDNWGTLPNARAGGRIGSPPNLKVIPIVGIR